MLPGSTWLRVHEYRRCRGIRHRGGIGLWFMYYNFARPHMTLTKKNGGIKQTPAMAAGVSDHVWKLEEVVGLLPE